MSDQNHRWWQFRISTILLCTLIVGMGIGWWLDRRRSHLRHRAELVEQRREIVRSIIESRVERIRSQLVGNPTVDAIEVFNAELPGFLDSLDSSDSVRVRGEIVLTRGTVYGEDVTIRIDYGPPETMGVVERVQLAYGEFDELESGRKRRARRIGDSVP